MSIAAGELTLDEQHILAAAYQADRLRAAALNLAGWIVQYLQNRKPGLGLDIVSDEVVDAAVCLAGAVVWNDIEFGRGGWVSQAKAGTAMAFELLERMPEARKIVERYPDVEVVTRERARLLAGKFATIENARACLAIVDQIPRMFVGPDAAQRRAAARDVWRRSHKIQDPPPPRASELLADALERLVPSGNLPDLVTLDQAAASVHTSKRTLERCKSEGRLPDPAVEGGGGRAALYDWKVLRPWLTKEFGVILPERFPANLR